MAISTCNDFNGYERERCMDEIMRLDFSFGLIPRALHADAFSPRAFHLLATGAQGAGFSAIYLIQRFLFVLLGPGSHLPGVTRERE